jgi:hypothetical protein
VVFVLWAVAHGPRAVRRAGFFSAAGFVFFDFFPLMVVAGVGGPADLFLFYLLQSAGAVVYCVLNLERIER